MTSDRLLQYFHRLVEAPNAIACLRRFILNLAVRGRLVEQDLKDEPASELLKRIRVAKAQLAKEGNLKRQREQTVEVDERSRFVTPQGWALTTLGEVALKITDGAHKTPTYVGEGVPFISVKDFSGGTLDFSSTRFISPEEHAMLYKRCDPRRGDILIGRIGTLGKAVLVETDVEFSLFVSVGLIRFIHDFTVPNYLRLLLNSPFVETEFDRIKVGGGTHTNKLNRGDLHTGALPIPPRAEQHRIVAKVDELMALCARLEAAQAERESRCDRLATASLHRLHQDADAYAFREHARFYFNHAPRLTAKVKHVQQLRQTILNLAVRGRLVPQDPNDNPASTAIDLVSKEAREAVRDGIIRRHGLSEAADDSGLSELPSGWRWTRLAEIMRPVPYSIKRGRFGSAIRKDMFVAQGVKVYEQQHASTGDFTN